MHRVVNLTAQIHCEGHTGHAADFPVLLRPLYYSPGAGQGFRYLPKRNVVVRQDTGDALAVVPGRRRVLQHRDLLAGIGKAVAHLDAGPVHRGVFVDRGGAVMRALYVFPALGDTIANLEDVCPCLSITNTYQATPRVAVHVGAYQLMYATLAVGGDGAFRGGVLTLGTVAQIARQLESFLRGFGGIVETFRRWKTEELAREPFEAMLGKVPRSTGKKIRDRVSADPAPTVHAAYTIATEYATRQTGSVRAAFALQELLNRGFQEHFPARSKQD